VTNWSNRLKLHALNNRARSVLTIALALRLLAPANWAQAEEEPAAKAPLPPPLAPSAAGAGEIQTNTAGPARERNRLNSDPPTIRFDRSEIQSFQDKPRAAAAPHRGARAGPKRDASSEPGDHSTTDMLRQRGRGAIASGGKPTPNRPLVGHAVGHLSPPIGYPAPQVESAAIAPVEPPRAPIQYYPGPGAGPPAYGYAPSYQYRWSPYLFR
jgi:hypothetical protein